MCLIAGEQRTDPETDQSLVENAVQPNISVACKLAVRVAQRKD